MGEGSGKNYLTHSNRSPMCEIWSSTFSCFGLSRCLSIQHLFILCMFFSSSQHKSEAVLSHRRENDASHSTTANASTLSISLPSPLRLGNFLLWYKEGKKGEHSLEVSIDELQSVGWIRLVMARQALWVMTSPGIDFRDSIWHPPGTDREHSNPSLSVFYIVAPVYVFVFEWIHDRVGGKNRI